MAKDDNDERISQDEINELLNNVFDKNKKKDSDEEKEHVKEMISDDEIEEILGKINLENKNDSDSYIPIYTPKRIFIADFMHPSSLSIMQIEELKKKFKRIIEYFEKDFYKITNKELICKMDEKETGPDSIHWLKKTLDSPNYVREIFIGNEQVLLQIDPIIINKVLLDRGDIDDITLISKRVANQYIFNLLKDYLRILSMSEVTEEEYSKTVYTTTSQFTLPDNIINNPRFIINTRSENNSTFKLVMQCTYKNIIGHIRIELSDQACFKFLGESESIYFPCLSDNQYYEDKNCYVSLGLDKITEERLQNIREGDVIVFDKFMGETLDFIYKGKKVANCEGVFVDYCYGVRITEILCEDEQESYPPGKCNSFLLLGTKAIEDKEFKAMNEGTIFELDSFIGNAFLLVCNNNVVAFGKLEDTNELFTLKIEGFLKDPIPFIN